MKKLLALLLFAPSMLWAQSPFDGTWMTKLDTAQFPKKPDKYLIDKGTYHCLTCVPKVEAKADGTDQKVTGQPYFDTIAIHVVDANSVEITEKKDGKTVLTEDDTISSDGNTMTTKFTDSTEAKFDGKDYPIQGDPGHTMVSLKRIGDDTIEETDKRNGKVVGVNRMTVSKDGKSIKVEYNDKEHGTTTTFMMEKQS